jgi:hypothetical protein
MRFRKLAFCAAVGVGLLSGVDTARGQDLGHKLPGLIGLDAARIPEPGLYLLDRFVSYEASELRDRRGDIIPVGELRLEALSNAVGLSYTIKFAQKSLSLTATAAGPIARFRLNVQDRPETSFDRFGLADVYIQPARLGWRQNRFDLIGSYGLYLPTGLSALAGGTGVSAGHVTHQFSAGGSIYADEDRSNFVTALASYDLNLRKRGVDITRGDTLQIQGGVGVSRFNRRVEAGLAGYALWQVRDDRGEDLPLVLRGARDRVYGLGPEIAVTIPAIRSQIRARYEWDIGVRSRPRGNVFSVGFNVLVQNPQQPVTK